VPKYPTLEDARQLLLNNVAPGTDPSATKEMLDPDFLAPIYHEQSKGRRFVYTQEGYFGLTPEPTQPGDLVCIILGCALPKVLRKIDPSAALSVPQTSPSSSSSSFFYQVIGQCYIHGLTNAEALLGTLPTSWAIKRCKDGCGRWQPFFLNGETGELVGPDRDPRMGPLPAEWERLAVTPEYEDDEGLFVHRYRNKMTGEVIDSDPQVSPDRLKARGVALRTFALK
jgi:hypothetical protein